VETEPLLQTVGQVSLECADIERSVSFYHDALGLDHVGTWPNLALVACGATRLLLAPPEGGERTGSSVVYFKVTDIATVYDALRSRSVVFEGPPHRIHRHPDGTEEWMAFFRDPDGNLLALMSQIKQ